MVMPAALKFAELYGTWMGVEVPFWNAAICQFRRQIHVRDGGGL